LKKAGAFRHWTHIRRIPRIPKKSAITRGGPRPNQELPDSEFAGSARLIPFSISSQKRIRPPTVGPTPTKKKFYTLRVSSRR
jgi:hypothetical protein